MRDEAIHGAVFIIIDGRRWYSETFTDATCKRAEAAEAKLQRVRDWLKYEANSEGGIVAEIDSALRGGWGVMPRAKRIVDLVSLNHRPATVEGMLASRVEKVLALHAQWKDGADNPVCKECCRIAGEWEAWPCQTVRILNGEE